MKCAFTTPRMVGVWWRLSLRPAVDRSRTTSKSISKGCARTCSSGSAPWVPVTRMPRSSMRSVTERAAASRSSLQLDHEVRLPDGVLAASGQTVLVAWDPHKRSKRMLSQAELTALGVPDAADRSVVAEQLLNLPDLPSQEE